MPDVGGYKPEHFDDLLTNLAGPHEWGYRDVTDGVFVSDAAPYEAAELLAALRAENTAFRKENAELREALRKAIQLGHIACDWHLPEVEIDGEMVSTYDLIDEFKAALTETIHDKG
jgi:hypothetical protein